jgi:hypothetical protein
VSNPEVQVQNALMRKWGLTSERSPDVDAIEAYNDIFRSRWGLCNAERLGSSSQRTTPNRRSRGNGHRALKAILRC